MIADSYTYDYSDINDRVQIFKILKTQEETHGTQLISFFFKKLKPDHSAKLRKEISESKNIKSKETQKIVLKGISTLLDAVTDLMAKPNMYEGPGALFVKGDFCVFVKLPVHYNMEIYHCGKSFRSDLLVETIEKAWGLIVLDTQEVSIGIFSNNRIQVLSNFDVFVPHKMKAGGQSAPRFEETRKLKVLELIEKVSNVANELFKKYDIEKILLGGVIPTSTNFYLNNNLLPEYKKMLLEPTSTCYTSPEGLQQLIDKNRDLYEAELAQYYEEKNQYDYILKNISEGVYVKEMILNLQINFPTTIWAVAGTSNLGWYCPSCKQLYMSNYECEHPKTDVKNSLARKYYFDPTSKFGQILSKRSNVFYETQFIV